MDVMLEMSPNMKQKCKTPTNSIVLPVQSTKAVGLWQSPELISVKYESQPQVCPDVFVKS